MGSNIIIGVIIGIIILAVVIFLVGRMLKKKNQERLQALEERKETFFAQPVLEELNDVRKMHLVGQSQNTFRDWNQRWKDVSTKAFAELESQIFEVESQNETFRFFKSKAVIEDAETTMTQMEDAASEIRSGLKELKETEERNSHAVQQALDVFEELKKELKENEEQYGPALPELEKQVKNVETEFTQFVTLNTSGDPVEARQVLETAEKHAYDVQGTMQKIPPLQEDVMNTFPGQIEEIEKTHQEMLEDSYVFPDEDVKGQIDQVKKRIATSQNDLERLDLETVEADNQKTADLIENLYQTLETEFEAKRFVLSNRETLKEYIDHAMKNNHQLMIELDHTAQSYVLNDNELGRARSFQTEIDELSRRNRATEVKANKQQLSYSGVAGFYKDAFKVLDDIETRQVEIDQGLSELRAGEKNARAKVEDFEFHLRGLKRYVDQQRLPGLPADYLEFFFVATDRVEELSQALNKIRINMQEINQLVDLCHDDMDLLDEKTNNLIDAAALAEQMMQYANRYRHTYPEVKDAIDESLDLFNKEYRYQDALDSIGEALERVEPGAYKRIEDFYFKNRELV
ncbi:septation ring formation regulator EzrA [Enterococcus sp. CSURQ0835]|uniref:septation ring formation regulator EzrA n=1 Tax=Enterococcus sp. CSURQ0835 TaxID=2681394 RepID=UPI00135B6C8B|nr:septation ring formation regulator EzrA [Enterococcus sp. CSURQ0835]